MWPGSVIEEGSLSAHISYLRKAQIGGDLGVSYVAEGSVRRAGERERIAVLRRFSLTLITTI